MEKRRKEIEQQNESNFVEEGKSEPVLEEVNEQQEQTHLPEEEEEGGEEQQQQQQQQQQQELQEQQEHYESWQFEEEFSNENRIQESATDPGVRNNEQENLGQESLEEDRPQEN